jgi:ribosomal protein S18 acetylase RimI-like enzyme
VLTVRPASASDVAALRAVAEAAYRGYVPRIGRPPAPMTADYAAAVASGTVWVAARDDAVVGLLVLLPRPDHLLLENVAVLPGEQGRGTGSQLLAFAEEQARQRGLPEIRLYTNEAMTGNIAYYRRRGYTETHRARDEGFSRVFFRKTLG